MGLNSLFFLRKMNLSIRDNPKMTANRVFTLPILLWGVLFGIVSALSVTAFAANGQRGGASIDSEANTFSPLFAGMTVNIGDSSWSDDGACSLREAIANANNDSQVFTSAGECPAGSGPDTITLAIDVTLTITDNNADGNGANGLPVITTTLTIDGAGYTLARADNGTPDFRFFYLNQGSTNLTLNDMIITNGHADTNNGGGLLMTAGQVMIESVTFSNNQANAGGAIHRSGTLRINNSRFVANQATNSGGAIVYTSAGGSGDAILNSLFDGNSSQGSGGALNINSAPNIVNSTFINNSADGNGGALSNSSQYPPRLYNVTIIGNTAAFGGGWYTFNCCATPLLYNSILSGNSATSSGDDCGGPSLSRIEAKNNVFGMNGDDGGCTGFAASSANNVTPAGDLGTIVATDGGGNFVLADNGGVTKTIALVASSPAINAGDSALLPNESTLGIDGDGDSNTDDPIDYDQRGFFRPQVSVTDAGAYQSQLAVYVMDEDGTLVADDLDGSTTAGNTNDDGVLAIYTSFVAVIDPGTYTAFGIGGSVTIAANGTFVYDPPPDQFGQAIFAFEITDNVSIVTTSLSLDVQSINDAPTFDDNGDLDYNQGARGNQQFIWATNISPGAANEDDSMLSFDIVTTDAMGVLATAPSLSNSGQLSLTFTGEGGTATLDIQLDDGDAVDNLSGIVQLLVNVTRATDLEVIIDNGLDVLPSNDTIAYYIVVTNNGPADVTNSSQGLITATTPPELLLQDWTCNGTACVGGSGDSDISEALNLALGESITYTINVTVQNDEAPVSFSTGVAVAGDTTENSPANNTDTDSDVIGLWGSGFEGE